MPGQPVDRTAREVRGSFPVAERSRRSLRQTRHRLRQDGRNEFEGAEIRECLSLRALRRSSRAREHRRKPAIVERQSGFAPERSTASRSMCFEDSKANNGCGPTNGSFRGAQWTMTHRATLGIALGSGSARGWAHIGVLRALTEAGIAPDFVAGCSMGAMVGAAFAAGRIEELDAWALSLDWRRVVGLVDVGLRGGVFKGDRLLNIYQGQFVECPFSELSVPFAAVATDLATGQEVWLREGKVSDAVRASCNVPRLFKPVLRDGRYLIDGSVVNPIPV